MNRPLLKVQCKSGEGKIGSEDVQKLHGTLAETELGLFISVGGFKTSVDRVMAGMPRMRLLDVDDLVELILDNYPALPDQAKETLRLRRVWVLDIGASGE